jgi:hypothetical protein
MKRIRMRKHDLFAAASVLCLVLITVFATAAPAQEQDGGAPGDWLSRYSTARTLGIGGAFVAAADEPLGALWNPACLTQVYQNAIHFETARLFEETSINGLSFASPERRILPGFGFTLLSLSSGEFERTNELNDVIGSFEEGDMAFLITASKSLSSRLAVGANIKIIRQSVDEFKGSGVGGDVGLLFDVLPTLRFGVSMLNIGGPNLTLRETEEQFPSEYRGGASLRVLSGRGLITTELAYHDWYGTRFHGGTEFWVHPTMALRVGYSDEYLTGGFSFRLANGVQFDYGAGDHILGMSHRFGVSYRFGGFFASSEAVPPVFSPLGTQSVTKIHLKSNTKADASLWRLHIVDKSSTVVRRFSGKGIPPAHVMWDGKDETGLPLPDGSYKYRLVVMDTEGRELVGPERIVEIMTSGPQGEVPIIISDQE